MAQEEQVKTILFYARWSPPSVLLAARWKGTKNVQLADVDSEFALCEEFRVVCVPTVVVLVSGSERKRMIGSACLEAPEYVAARRKRLASKKQ